MPRVIISANKTTKNPGRTIGNIREVDITRDIVKNVVPHLRSSGVLTLSTPRELETEEKIEWINRTGYSAEHNDITIEIHLNQGDGSKSGSIAWYSSKDGDKSKSLLANIQKFVADETPLSDQGLYKENQHPNKRIDFLSKAKPISGIFGAGFVDNNDDIEFFKNAQNLEKLGKSIAKGITKFLNIDFKESKVQIQQPRPTVPAPMANRPSAFGNDNPMNQLSNFDKPSFSQDFGGGASAFNKPAGGSGSYLASREDRKEMIKKNYSKILGREPNQSDLNYFLNTGIAEDQLIKKMIDSQEHVDLVKSRQEILTTKAKFHAMQAELLQLQAGNDDKTDLINNMNALIGQKNIALTAMHKKIQYYEGNMNERSNEQQAAGPTSKYRKSFTDKLLDFFSDRLG